MEMSDLSLYFPEEKNFLQTISERIFITKDMWWGFAVGAAGSLILSQIFLRSEEKEKS